MSHNQTIENHVFSNLEYVIDQLDTYDSLSDAMNSGCQNVVDSSLEDGYSKDESFNAGTWFIDEFRKRTGFKG